MSTHTRNHVRARPRPRAATSPPESQRAKPSLAVTMAGIRFAHPVLAASGPLGFGRELQSVFDFRTFGGFVTKSVTSEPRPGNARPQVVHLEAGWLNSIGLANHGLAVFLTKDLPFLRSLGIPIIVSVVGETVRDFVAIAEWLEAEEGVAGLELNVSCPNVRDGLVFGIDPHMTAELVANVRRVSRLPLIVKLTPNVTDITVIARAAQDAGADALALINTLVGMAIDVETRRSKLGTLTGGLSGPAIKPIALRMVWQVARTCQVPVIGVGGIATVDDALEFLIAGAQVVAVGSAAIERPGIATEIQEGLRRYLVAHEMDDIAQVVGSLEDPGPDVGGPP